MKKLALCLFATTLSLANLSEACIDNTENLLVPLYYHQENMLIGRIDLATATLVEVSYASRFYLAAVEVNGQLVCSEQTNSCGSSVQLSDSALKAQDQVMAMFKTRAAAPVQGALIYKRTSPAKAKGSLCKFLYPVSR